MLTSDAFLDTAFAVALAIQSDQYHERASALAQEIRSRRGTFITTQAVVLEIGNMLSPVAIRSEGIRLINSLRNDGRVDIVTLAEPVFDGAWNLFRTRHDKDRGLVDCISIVVMRERGIIDALTADRHFVQAGFRALLLEDDN